MANWSLPLCMRTDKLMVRRTPQDAIFLASRQKMGMHACDVDGSYSCRTEKISRPWRAYSSQQYVFMILHLPIGYTL
jgi:hypothetical protein